MTTPQTFVVVGASLAGAKAAETPRAEGFTGRVVLVGEEAERPYQRPPLSKDYLRGDTERDKVFVHDESFYADHDSELRTNTLATALDPDGHTATLTGDANDEQLSYDRLLLTTGSRPRRYDKVHAQILHMADMLTKRHHRPVPSQVPMRGRAGSPLSKLARTVPSKRHASP